MADHIIDTNVLLVASASHPGSPFGDSDVPAEQQLAVLVWLMAFRQDTQRKLVLDGSYKIWDEYHQKLTPGRDYGSLVVMDKLQRQSWRFVDISFDQNGHARVPRELENVVHDPADRKFVAVALSDISGGNKNSIVNASDTDWYDWEEALHQAGVVVEHVIDDWCRDKWKEKRKRSEAANRHKQPSRPSFFD